MEFIVLRLKNTLKGLVAHHPSICLSASEGWDLHLFETSLIIHNKTPYFSPSVASCLCFMILTQREGFSVLREQTLVTGIFSLCLTHGFWGQRISSVVSETVALNTSSSSRFSQTLYDPKGHFTFPPTSLQQSRRLALPLPAPNKASWEQQLFVCHYFLYLKDTPEL